MKAVKYGEHKRLSLLIQGSPGGGKSTLAGSANLDERTSPVLYVSAAGNPQVLKTHPTPPPTVEIETLADLNTVYTYLATGQKRESKFAQALGLHEMPDIKTVVVDQLSEVQLRFAYMIAGIPDAPGDISKTLQLQHYNPLLMSMTQLAGLFYRLPMHVIMTVQERKLEPDQETDPPLYQMQLMGASIKMVPSYALNVMRVAQRASLDPHTRRLVPSEELRAASTVAFFQPAPSMPDLKDQHLLGIPYMVNPTVTKILDRLGW